MVCRKYWVQQHAVTMINRMLNYWTNTRKGCSNFNELNNIISPFNLETVECEHLLICWQSSYFYIVWSCRQEICNQKKNSVRRVSRGSRKIHTIAWANWKLAQHTCTGIVDTRLMVENIYLLDVSNYFPEFIFNSLFSWFEGLALQFSKQAQAG